MMDVLVSLFVLIVFSPLLALLALLVYLESGAPVLFRHERVGRGFRRFHILKFRSMRTAAGPSITVGGDSRITRVGRTLRLTKLDELPQFWNVLVGEMSLVGPRPEVPEYVEMYEGRFRRLLTLRPGLTDLASIQFWQEELILSRSSDPLREYAETILPAKLDLGETYLERQSLAFDLKILLKTLLTSVRPR